MHYKKKRILIKEKFFLNRHHLTTQMFKKSMNNLSLTLNYGIYALNGKMTRMNGHKETF